jgi:5'-nucleotidase
LGKRSVFRTSLSLLIAALLFIGSVGPVWAGGGDAAIDQSRNKRLIDVQILGINDFHGQLNVTQWVEGRPAGRADYLAAHLKRRAAENKNTLIVHAGDMVGASPPISALLQDEPTIDFLNRIGVDVGTVGNHEFDEGVEEMLRLINGGSHPNTGYFPGAKFPYVVANVLDKKTGKPVLPPYVVKRVKGVPIGFVGVVLTDTPSLVNPGGVKSVRFVDETAAINQAVKKLKKKGVRAIVVLAHVPGTSNLDGSAATGEIVDVAKSVDDEVDVIFAAHSHQYMNAVVDDKLLVQAYSYGTAYADVDLAIDPKTKDITRKRAEIVTVWQEGIKPDPKIRRMIEYYEEKTAPMVNKVVGTAAKTIRRAQNESGESELGNLIADAQRTAMQTDFVFMNPGGIRADIEQGEVTWGELFTVQPFGNNLVKMTLTGEQIRRLLNQQWQQPNNHFLQISGLRYTWDDTRPVGDKVVAIFLPDGSRIDPDAVYTVTANSFLAEGGDNFTVFTEGSDREVGPVDLDALVEYVKQLPQPFSASIEGRIEKLQ